MKLAGCSDQGPMHLEYLLPERLAPWPAAYVTGEATSEDDAVDMIVKAMTLSEGWSSR